MIVPIGLASLTRGFKPVRGSVDRHRENVMPRHAIGCHSAHQVPDVLVASLRGFDGRDLLANHVPIRADCRPAWFRYVGTGTTLRAVRGGIDVDGVIGTPSRDGATLRYDVFVHV